MHSPRSDGDVHPVWSSQSALSHPPSGSHGSAAHAARLAATRPVMAAIWSPLLSRSADTHDDVAGLRYCPTMVADPHAAFSASHIIVCGHDP